jgi:predicted AlkP superfamily phosphohydrolase/phosphomutase
MIITFDAIGTSVGTRSGVEADRAVVTPRQTVSCPLSVAAPALTIVGLDAATFDVIDPLVDAGDLPNLGALLEHGARGVLASTTHPLTPLAWTTMVTGVNAGHHGIWDFSERDDSGYRLRLVNGSHSRAAALWTRLSRNGRRVGVVNVPFTWPAPEVDGFVIAGMDAAAREDGMTYPRSLVDTIQERFGRLLLDHSFPLDRNGAIDLDYVRRSCAQRVEIARWLTEEHAPELLFTVFMAADHVHHLAWPDWERRGRDSVVAEVYRILDGAVGDLLDAVGARESDVMVVSDHGGGSLSGVVNLNAWLAQHGWLSYGRAKGEGARKRGHDLYELRRLLPDNLRYAVKQRIPRLRERAYGLRGYSIVDWSQTQAFSYGTFGNIVLNVRGRERDGIVEPGAPYERLRDEIAQQALELRSPAGEQIVRAVHRREDLFNGAELEKVPDLIVEFRDYAWLGKGNLTARTSSIWDDVSIHPSQGQVYAGSHRPDGMFVLAGPSSRSAETSGAGILDIAPTVLFLLGEPIPGELEGRLLAEALDPALLQGRQPEYAEPETIALGSPQQYEDEGTAEVEQRLRSLGYIE